MRKNKLMSVPTDELPAEEQLAISLEKYVPGIAQYINITPQGMLVSNGMPAEMWGKAFCGITAIRSSARLWLMDLLQFGDLRYDDATVTYWSEKAGLSPDSIRNLRSLGKSVPPDMRRDGLTAAHYDVVAGVKIKMRRQSLIDWAATNNATVIELRAERKAREPKPEQDDSESRASNEVIVANETDADELDTSTNALNDNQPLEIADFDDDDLNVYRAPVPQAVSNASDGWILAVTYIFDNGQECGMRIGFREVPCFARGLRSVLGNIPEQRVDYVRQIVMRPMTDDMPDPNWLIAMDWKMEFPVD